MTDRSVADLLTALVLTRARAGTPFVLGLCGAQGSGKSTAAEQMVERLAASGRKAVILSLDDLYLSRASRRALGETIDPLLQTRGVPGTHDVAQGLRVLTALREGLATTIPRFDKAADDIASQAQWPTVAGPVDVVIFEGWCVGARPQQHDALAAPINDLERIEDRDGRWRRHANERLAGDYQRLFALTDALALIAAPGFETVHIWRGQQEAALRSRLAGDGQRPGRAMSDADIARFVSHYERLTRHILREMPERADYVIDLDPDRRILSARERRP